MLAIALSVSPHSLQVSLSIMNAHYRHCTMFIEPSVGKANTSWSDYICCNPVIRMAVWERLDFSRVAIQWLNPE